MRTLRLLLAGTGHGQKGNPTRGIKVGTASILTIGLLAGSGIPASAHDSECVQRAWDLPIETMSVPKDLAWDELGLTNDGLYGTLYRPGGDPLDGPSLFVLVECVHDPVAGIDRNQQIRDHIGATEVLETPSSLGPDAAASRVTAKGSFNRGNMAIEWPRGDLVVEVSSWDLEDYELLKELALALDAVLPSGELATPPDE